TPHIYPLSLHDALPISRGSGSTTNAGSSWLSEPSPYDSHAPRHGKPFIVKPLFIWNVAGVWLLLLATIEWTNVMSSTQAARFGRSEEHTSELQSPDHLV